MRIHKLELQKNEVFTLKIPAGAEMLHVQTQRGWPCVWFKCDPNMPLVERRFFMQMTGQDLHPDAHTYLGTIQLEQGWLVIHYFMEGMP